MSQRCQQATSLDQVFKQVAPERGWRTSPVAIGFEQTPLLNAASLWSHNPTRIPSWGRFLAGERVERRLAAILAADVAGFSALMERDEEGTFARIGSLRCDVIEPLLSDHQGPLIKTTGDGLLADFASPT